MGRALSWWWRLLGLLLLVAIWVCAAARVTVQGLPLGVLERLARGQGLLTDPMTPWLDPLSWLARLPGDSLRWAAVFMAVGGLGAALLIGLVAQNIWKNAMSSVLMIGLLFFGSNTMWALSTSPIDSLEVLFLACSVAAIISGSVPTLGGCILATTAVSPATGLALYPVLAYLCYKREKAYGMIVSSATLFGVGCLLIPIAGTFRWEPSCSGLTLFSILPIGLILFGRKHFFERTGTYVSLIFGALLSGSAELATPIALADLAHYALTSASMTEQEESLSGGNDEKTWSVSLPVLASVLATVLLTLGVLKGEQSLNRQILIPAQKAKLPLSELFGFFSLSQHSERFTEESWRASIPFPELKQSDLEAAQELHAQNSSGFTVLTLASESEPRRLSLLYALLAKRPLQGWDDPEHLAGPLLLCKLRGQNFLSSGPEVLFRGADGSISRPQRPTYKPKPNDQAALELGGALAVPYRIQTINRNPGASYRWHSGTEEYVLSFNDQAAEMILTDRVGKVTISSVQDPKNQRVVEIFPLRLELAGFYSDSVWPSRSLVPLRLVLANRGQSPVTSELISNVLVKTSGAESFSPFVQKISKRFILFPEESIQLSLQLATPEPEGMYEVQVFIRTPAGEEFRIPLLGTNEFRTRRRLPPSPSEPASPQAVEEP